MKRYLFVILWGGILLVSSSNSTQATIIDFEDHAVADGSFTDVSSDFVSRGYLFDTAYDHGHFVNNINGVNHYNSTYFLTDDSLGENPITLTNQLGSSFALQSLYVAEWVETPGTGGQEPPTSITVTGNYATSGSITTSITLDTTLGFQFHSFNSTDWSNLSSVVFQGVGGPVGKNFYALDDITVAGATPPQGAVPEPTTMLLLGTGLVGVAGAARRKKKNQA